jgi:alkylated DNA nucleotide flippase Atl1
MQRVDNDFKERVYMLVSQIPRGRVMTYGQIAALAGAAWAAWEVGQIAHFAPCAGLKTCPANPMSGTGLDEVQGKAEQRTEAYMKYGEGATEALTRQFAKSKSGAAGSASRQALAACPAHDLPWQRVVNKKGGLAWGYTPGGYAAHKRDLEAEGVAVDSDYRVDIGKLLWFPPHQDQNLLL